MNYFRNTTETLKEIIRNKKRIVAKIISLEWARSGPTHRFSNRGSHNCATFSISRRRLHGGYQKGKFLFSCSLERKRMPSRVRCKICYGVPNDLSVRFAKNMYYSAEKWGGHGPAAPQLRRPYH